MESEQPWVSNITYMRTLQGFSYLSLITHAFSRKIVGYCLRPTLETAGCLEALEMTLQTRKKICKLIHHSNRGIQYCSAAYVEILTSGEIAISRGSALPVFRLLKWYTFRCPHRKCRNFCTFYRLVLVTGARPTFLL